MPSLEIASLSKPQSLPPVASLLHQGHTHMPLNSTNIQMQETMGDIYPLSCICSLINVKFVFVCMTWFSPFILSKLQIHIYYLFLLSLLWECFCNNLRLNYSFPRIENLCFFLISIKISEIGIPSSHESTFKNSSIS